MRLRDTPGRNLAPPRPSERFEKQRVSPADRRQLMMFQPSPPIQITGLDVRRAEERLAWRRGLTGAHMCSCPLREPWRVRCRRGLLLHFPS